ncbi:MAG: transcription antitermination factor NusB [Gammaproteobacteria bacterium]|nr:transcription antitermination factor NusB [Gammaproteobacteria bacterium]
MTGRGRHGARRLLVQALYQHQLGGHELDSLLQQFSADPAHADIDDDFFRSMLTEILRTRSDLDARIEAGADRPVAQLDPVERGVLWIGITELTRRADVPHRVVINEAVELAKEFGAQDSYRYVNAILDGLVGEGR